MFCRNCGNEIENTAAFCNKCGSKVLLEDKVLVELHENSLHKNANNNGKKRNIILTIAIIIVFIALIFEVVFALKILGKREKEGIKQLSVVDEIIDNTDIAKETIENIITDFGKKTEIPGFNIMNYYVCRYILDIESYMSSFPEYNKMNKHEQDIFMKNAVGDNKLCSVKDVDLSRRACEFDENGQLLSRTFYKSKNNINHKYEYDYDIDGHEVSRILYNEDMDVEESIKREFDNRGLCQKQYQQNSEGESVSETEFNNAKKPILTITSDADGNVMERIELVYDARDLCTNINTYDSDGNLIGYSLTEYDEKGRMLKEKFFENDILNYEIEFEYDTEERLNKLCRNWGKEHNTTYYYYYNSDGLIDRIKQIDSHGNSQNYVNNYIVEYDDCGRVDTVTFEEDTIYKFTWAKEL